MNKKEFKREITMGFGSVITFLKSNPHLSKRYNNLILWACSHDLRYDTQVEAMRSKYLFDIINSSENRDSLELEILTRVMNNRKGYDVNQLLEIAVLIYKNGNSKAKEVIYQKFAQIYSILLKKNSYDDYYSYLLNECADSIMSIDGLAGLEYISLQYGKILANHNKECIDDYHFIHMRWYWFDEVFEQETINLFYETKSKANQFIKIYYDEYKRNIRDDDEKRTERITPDYKMIIDVTDSLMKEKKLTKIKTRQLALMGRKTNEHVLLLVAKEIESTKDEKRMMILLNIFIETIYPLNIDFLLQLTERKNKDLVSVALETLKHFKDERLYTIAFRNLHKQIYIFESLDLLVKNFNNDFDLIEKILNKFIHKDELHGITFTIRDIAENHHSTNWLEILKIMYHHNRCTYCRNHVIELMIQLNIIPSDIKMDCLYDCNLETRKLVSNQ